MSDDHVHRWLTDDPLVLNAVVVVAATTVAVALTSCLWHHIHTDPDQHLSDDSPSAVSAALAFLHFSVARTVPQSQQQSLAVPAQEAEQRDHKSTRSKERRRRGKDPLRDIFKGGKKSKALLKALKATDHDNPPPSTDALSNSSAAQNDTASSSSRSQSPEPTADISGMDRLTPHLGVDSDDGSARSTTPNGNTSSTSAVTSAADGSEHGSSDAGSQMDGILVTTDADASISSASTVLPHASEGASSSPTDSTACADVCAPQSRDSQAAYTTGSCAKLVRARTRLRLSRMDPSVQASLLSSTPPPLPDSVATLSDPVLPIVPCPSLLITPSTSHSTDGAGPSTPTNSRGATPPRSPSTLEDPSPKESRSQPLDDITASAHMQLASMRSALEASRLREEQLRLEAEQASKERDELRWGWNEDASAWRRREAELQAQIHHLMHQLQAYAAVASFQAQQASSAFSSPTSPHPHSSPRLHRHPLAPFPLPPQIQPQNSASPPAHVQALLASAPMLTSHPPGFAGPSGGFYPGPGFGMSPLVWSGLGLCVPNRDAGHGGRQTPDSSASGSSSRGRRRQRHPDHVKNGSDDSSLGEWEDGSGNEGSWEEGDDIFRNNVLADAILKRPESIRGLGVGKRSRGRPSLAQGGIDERMAALKDPALENPGFMPPFVDAPIMGP